MLKLNFCSLFIVKSNYIKLNFHPKANRPTSVHGNPMHGPSTPHSPTPSHATTPSSQHRPTVKIPQQPVTGGFPPLSPSSPAGGHSSTPSSPTGGNKSWADIAGKGGNGFGHNTPTPSPRPLSPSTNGFGKVSFYSLIS